MFLDESEDWALMLYRLGKTSTGHYARSRKATVATCVLLAILIGGGASVHAETTPSARHYCMLSPSLFCANRITSDLRRFRYSPGFYYALPAEELPPPGQVFHLPTPDGIPFLFPAGSDANALLASGVSVPLPEVRCTGIWILAASERDAYKGRAVIEHVGGGKEIANFAINHELGYPGRNEEIAWTADHYHYRARDTDTGSAIQVFAQRIPVGKLSAVRRLTIENDPRDLTTGSCPVIYAATIEYLSAPPHTIEVSGQLVTRRGTGIPNAVVRLGPYQDVTDAYGRFRFADVVPGDYQFTGKRLGCHALERNGLHISSGNQTLELPHIVMQSTIVPVAAQASLCLQALLILAMVMLLADVVVGRRSRQTRLNGRSAAFRTPASTLIRVLIGLKPDEDVVLIPELFGLLTCSMLLAYLRLRHGL